MSSNRVKSDGLLARVNFPLYTLQMLTSRHVLVGGGGGSAKTGVANGFEIYELSHNGKIFIAEEVVRHETGPTVVMNSSAFSDLKHSYIVAGQESHCQLYNVQSILVLQNEESDQIESDGSSSKNNLRHRKNHVKDTVDNNKNSKRLKFKIQPADSVQTDFSPNEPLQRIVRIHPKGKLMATGGVDGIIRLWTFPGMKKAKELKAHKKELDDIDFSSCENYLVSVAKDGLAILWDTNSGKEVNRLSWAQPEGSKYLYKRCRFGIVEGQPQNEVKKSALYMLTNPVGVAGKQKGYLQQWNIAEASLRKAVAIDESLAALAVRDDGRFVAIGTMFSGSVSVFVAFSLQRVLHIPGAHSMFVTGLEFLPVATDNHTVASVSEAAVLSISVDNRVCIHSLQYRRTIPIWISILLIIVVLFFTFMLCSYVGL